MNMKAWLLGGLLGGLAYYVLLSLAWTVLPFHMAAMNDLDDTRPVAQAMTDAGMETGVYTLPSMSEWEADEEAFNARHRSGPVAFVVFKAEGHEPMAPMTFVNGILLCLAQGLIVAFVVGLFVDRMPSYLHRVMVVTLIGLLTAVAGPVTTANWFYYPAGWVWAEIFDHVVGYMLAGLVIAAFVKPAKVA